MSGSPAVTISLVALNQRPDLERLLPTLMPAAGRADAEVLLVNNRSTDGTKEFLAANYPGISVVENHDAAGYGENHNINLKRSAGRYFVIMNSDMTVRPDTFALLRDFMDANPDVGAACPKVLNPDGSIQGLNKLHPTVWDLFLRRFMPRPFKKYFKRRMDAFEMRDVGYSHSYYVPSVSGCFMFCRAGLLKKLGGFDEKYFLYFEDTDLCRSIQKTHRTMYLPEAEVTHFWARSAHVSFRAMVRFIHSTFRYFNKWGYKLF
ncbi:MAG: glycosyltransferase family 2 protein [Elusimicrobia bacterium]|nr:glycosyltransferase family 2 protein [Elusimicrobiota bacterium]